MATMIKTPGILRSSTVIAGSAFAGAIVLNHHAPHLPSAHLGGGIPVTAFANTNVSSSSATVAIFSDSNTVQAPDHHVTMDPSLAWQERHGLNEEQI